MRRRAPAALFAVRLTGDPRNNYARSYHVSRDGHRFVVDTAPELTLPITVVMNWAAAQWQAALTGFGIQRVDELVPLVHNELRRLAKHYTACERPGHTLEARALVNDAYLRRGLSLEDTAEALHVSVDTVKRDWRFAKLWLMREPREQQ